jgi:hypothetical protein
MLTGGNTEVRDSTLLRMIHFNYKQDLTNSRFKISMDFTHEMLKSIKTPMLNIGTIFNKG